MEWIPSGDLKQLQKACLRKEGGLGIFCLLSGTYLMTAGAEGLAVALGGGYEDILIDFGDGNEGNWAEFLRCDRQFLIGSLSEWQLERFREFEMSRRPDGKKTWRTLAAFGSEETRREMNRRYRMEVERIPFSADAFAITNECRIFFDRLLSENCR